MDILKLISPYSPWLNKEAGDEWRTTVPDFKRPVFYTLREDLDSIEQIISITGPRRVGKSTLLKQLVAHLLDEKKIDPQRVIYYQFDDPALFRPGQSGGELVEQIMDRANQMGETSYLFLDEIQTLERWEQYLKNTTT